ncbi:MAG: hypothetical protein ACOYOK_10635 [Pseudobdellovibrionaceae bacterium]
MKQLILFFNYKICIFLLLLGHTNAESKELQSPITRALESSEKPESIQLKCESEDEFKTMSCSFIQTLVYPNSEKWDPKELSVEKAKNLIQDACKDKTDPKLVRSDIDELFKPSKRNDYFFKYMNNICACKKADDSKECIHTVTQKFFDEMPKTCRIMTNDFKIDFKRKSKDSWEAKYNTFVCPSLKTITLKRKSSSKDVLDKWEFIQTTVYEKIQPEDLCKNLTGKTVTDTYRTENNGQTYTVKCDQINF